MLAKFGRNCLVLISALCLLAGPAWPQGAGTARLVWPYPAGGIPDALARYLAEELSNGLKEKYIVENRAGAAGRTGTAASAGAAPDGKTLLLATVAMMSVYPIVYPNLNYNPFIDFRPVSQVSRFDLALTAGPKAPVRSLAEYVEWVKKDAANTSYSTPSAGSLPHFFATEFGKTIGVPLVFVPYQGATPAINDLIAGHLPMGVFGTTEVVELHKGSKLRILATSGTKRSQFVPDVPTFQEQGFNIQGYGWFGVFAPAKTPDDFVNRAARVLADAIRSPQGKARLETFGMEPIGSTPEELQRIQRADFEFWTPVVRASGFKPAD